MAYSHYWENQLRTTSFCSCPLRALLLSPAVCSTNPIQLPLVLVLTLTMHMGWILYAPHSSTLQTPIHQTGQRAHGDLTMNVHSHAFGIQDFYKRSGHRNQACAGAVRNRLRGHCTTCSAAHCSSLSVASLLKAYGAGAQRKTADYGTEPQPGPIHLLVPAGKEPDMLDSCNRARVSPVPSRGLKHQMCPLQEGLLQHCLTHWQGRCP